MHAAPSADLTELLCTVQNTGRADGGTTDRANITADRKLELPKAQMPSDFFYLTDDGETTRNHPRQQTLALRKVAPQAQPSQFKEA